MIKYDTNPLLWSSPLTSEQILQLQKDNVVTKSGELGFSDLVVRGTGLPLTSVHAVLPTYLRRRV